MAEESRLCLQCGKALKGRLDKKFCDDYCRNAYNNRLNSETSSTIRNINNALRKNRRLLAAVIPDGGELGKCPRQSLAQQGFDFRYFTHQYQNKKGQTYNFCYEYGYLPLEGDWLLVVYRKSGRKSGNLDAHSD